MPSGAVPSVPAGSVGTGAPYPSAPAGGAPYPSVAVPVGTGAGAPPAAGTGAPTGYMPPSPSSPSEFTGAASALNVGGFVAGVGAFAAFFL
jgi:hypothetical protein